MNKCHAILSLLCLLLFTNLNSNAQTENLDKIIAIVGDRIVLRSEFEAAFEDYKRDAPELPDSFRCELLEQMLLQKVLIEQADLDSVIVSDEEIEGALDNRIRYFISMYGTEEKLEEVSGKTTFQLKDDYRPMFRDKMIADRMQNQVMSNIKITPQEVKAFYDKIPTDSLPFYPSMVEVGHIVFRPDVNKEVEDYAISTLREIRAEIISGRSTFETMAGTKSQDPLTRDNGGDLGIMGRDELVPEFSAAAFKLQNGEISDVVKTSYGYHIIQMVNRQGEKAKMRHILIKPQITSDMIQVTMNKADSVWAGLVSGKIKFNEAIAKYHSDDATKFTGGMFVDQQTGASLIQVEDLEPSVALIVNDMKPGEYSKPVEFKDDKTGDRLVHIVYLKKRTEPHKANLQEDYARIQQAAFAKKQTGYLMKWLESRLPSFYIKIDPEFNTCPNISRWNQFTTKK